MSKELVERAREALERGEPEAARNLMDRALAEDASDPETLELYTVLHLARAIRLTAAAREARRRDIVERDILFDEPFEDSPAVARAYADALAAVDDILRINPRQEKALMVRASVLFRQDRERNRAAALEILRGIVEANPANRQVASFLKKMEKPCPRCSDTGFCPYCRGRGTKRLLRMERKCEACYGQGICPVCGVL